jgi:hypothetical protein
MTISPRALVLLAAGLAMLTHIAGARADCPTTITDAARRAYPDAAITKCSAHKSGYEVKLQKKDKSIVELDLSANGEIEQVEEVVPISAIPDAVTKAFATRYPRATIVKAERQQKADKSISFELAFKSDKGRKEATFKDDGTFVEEE